MNKLLAVLALGASLSAAFAQSDAGSTTSTTTIQSSSIASPRVQIGSFMSDNNLSWEDAAAAMAIARATGVQPSDVLAGRGSLSTSFYDLAPAYWIARNSGQPVSSILDMYNSGRTWLDIARNYNVANWMFNPDSADTSSWTNTDFTNAVWRNMLNTHYAMSSTDYDWFSSSGSPLNEVVVAEVYGLETGQPIRDIWNTYANNGNNWTVVQTTYVRSLPVAQTQSTEVQDIQSSQQSQTTTRVRTTQTRTITQVRAARPQTTVRRTSTRRRTVASHRPVRRHRVASSHRAMRMVRRHHRRQCVCTCPEHKKMVAFWNKYHRARK